MAEKQSARLLPKLESVQSARKCGRTRFELPQINKLRTLLKGSKPFSGRQLMGAIDEQRVDQPAESLTCRATSFHAFAHIPARTNFQNSAFDLVARDFGIPRRLGSEVKWYGGV
jgi:hypothetical protein